MGSSMISDVLLTKLARVKVPGGDVLHAMKCCDPGYMGFGEAYFSFIKQGVVKGWKRHQKMTLNLVVPVGAVRFVMYDDRPLSPTCGQFQQLNISPDNYGRLTIPPMVWLGFEGVGGSESLVMNLADMMHDPEEVDRLALADIDFNWSGSL